MHIEEVLAPDHLADRIPPGIPVTQEGRLASAQGRGKVESVTSRPREANAKSRATPW